VTTIETNDDAWMPLPPRDEPRPAPPPATPPPRSAASLPTAPVLRPAARGPARATTAPDPDAERRLAELQQRIASVPKSKGPLQSAFRRASRRSAGDDEALADASGVAEVPPPPPSAAPPDAAVVVGYDRATDRDPREDEPWFRDLPEPERARLRGQWAIERHRFDDRALVLRRRLVRAAWHGALVFFVLSLLQAPLLGLGPLPLLTLAGALASVLAQALGGGRFVHAFAGATAFVVVMGPTVFVQPFGLIGLLAASYGLGAVGMDREMRRSGGFDARS
jgi:hypothetical protein